jgi:hypothetical protein
MYKMELRDSRGFERLKALVCILCGEIMDSVIAANRKKDMAHEMLLPKSIPRHSKYWRRIKSSTRYRRAEEELAS